MEQADCVPGRFGSTQFAGAQLGDERRTKRLIRLADQILLHPGGTLPDKIPDPYQLDSAYRFFAEPEVTPSAILTPHTTQVRQAMTDSKEVILIPHDSTELNYSSLTIADLGILAGRKSRGILCHNSLAITTSGRVLGLAHQALLCPRPKPAQDNKAQARTNPHKISNLWRDAVTAIGPTPPGCRWIHVADRGADITELLDYADEQDREYVVRASHNRNIEWEGDSGLQQGHLFPHLRSFPAVSMRTQKVSQQGNRPQRTAHLAIAWTRVRVIPPRQARGRERGIPLWVTAIRVWEPDPPKGIKPLEWMLLTNVPVTTVEEAWERADWYGQRWGIEEFHKCQKTGVGLEKLELTGVHRLSNAIAVLSVVAVALLVLRDLARQDDAATTPARTILPPIWVELLSLWRYGEVRELTIREWILALGRLGGHQNRPSNGLPGWQTLWKGWQKLALMREGYRLHHEKCGGS